MGVTLTDNSKQAKDQLKKNKEKALTMIGIKWQEIATKEITALGAVDTGRLRASLTYQPDLMNERVIVGTNVEYAPYVEFGTIRMASRPYLSNSILNYIDDYLNIVIQVLGEGFKLTTGVIQ